MMIKRLAFLTLFSANLALAQETTPWPALSFSSSHIDKQELRKTYIHLSQEAYDKKLQASLESPLLFFRSFVNTYYADLSAVTTPSDLIPCFGDPHIENFGFMEFPDKTRFVFNDLDDSGLCPLPLDLLRYFSSLVIFMGNETLLKEMAAEYTAIIIGTKKAQPLPAALYPSLEKKRASFLKKHTHGGTFKSSAEMKPLPVPQRSEMLAALQKHETLKDVQLLDVAETGKDSGGSAGLRRYLLLIEKAQKKDVLELKELNKPGTTYGSWTESADPLSARLEKIKQQLWHGSPHFYTVVELEKIPFLLRSRIDDSLNVNKMTPAEMREYFRVQVGILATHHRPFFKKSTHGLESWLLQNTAILKDRYIHTYKILKP
ncbi:DUF2252 family protein [Bdellovibrio bacteriovorus]|uniref:DUF2252 family protein n=1 Tax=Bdellovibrio bacteriovorus TaxID=959 RepID=UPI0035A665C0